MGDILFEYQTAASGVVQLREILDGEVRHLVVDAVNPIPQKVALLAADALNALRAALSTPFRFDARGWRRSPTMPRQRTRRTLGWSQSAVPGQ